MQSHQTVYLKDYQEPDYWIDQTTLVIDLEEAGAQVQSTLRMRRHERADQSAMLRLSGEGLHLASIQIDGRVLDASEYQLDDSSLCIPIVPQVFTLETVVLLHPEHNKVLSGLYRSKGLFCTQCEAQGFRRITYYLDRPDVLSRFTTTIRAAKKACPVLLSNGNLIASGAIDTDRHFATWADPFPKPCYLFALVAGDLICLRDHFVTMSNQLVALEIYTHFEYQDQCQHAMLALKKAMRWDEETYGREYDLDRYMIVAVTDFNMGAMENKGLNIFNAKYILANPQTATDTDYAYIDAVVGHEYFHNWSGNRVTCRDWFQLSLKEGLTVFREHQFCASISQSPATLIDQVIHLRADQFPEDSGPMAHSVQPDAYLEIDNFYTSTIYEKGAAVIRMLQQLIGGDAFRRGMDHYFQVHDGKAVTIQDLIQSMAKASGQDLSQFLLWYSQAGTPEITVQEDYQAEAQRYTLSLTQHCPDTPGQSAKKPFLIPIALGLLDAQGLDQLAPQTQVILKAQSQSFVFESIQSKPILSILRSFSAPVKINMPQSKESLSFLLAHDSDPFNRWEAGQSLSTQLFWALVDDFEQKRPLVADPHWLDAHQTVLQDPSLDPALKAQILTLPSMSYLMELRPQIKLDAMIAVHRFLALQLAQQLKRFFLLQYEAHHDNSIYVFEPSACASRRLANLCLHYLVDSKDPEALALCLQQWRGARSMTDRMGVLNALCDYDGPERSWVLSEFYEQWQHHPVVLDKWFRIQALSELPQTFEQVQQLMTHAAFDLKNPNKVYALIGAFSMGNLQGFHDPSGKAYDWLADVIITLNGFNPKVAARMIEAFSTWQRFDAARQAKMRLALEKIQRTPNLSPDLLEVLSKYLQV